MAPIPTTSITRRRLVAAAVTAGGFAIAGRPSRALAPNAGPFSLPALPYPENALAPVISAATVSLHYGKHHQAYVNNLNKALAGSALLAKPLEEIIKLTAADPSRTIIFDNAAQDWNHILYWNSMRPGGGGPPSGAVADLIKNSFGDYGRFRKRFVDASVSRFGSGWAWLVQNHDHELKIITTANADTPLVQGMNCLLTCDLWEHAYYLDYQNRRLDYVNAWLDKLANWEFVAQRIVA